MSRFWTLRVDSGPRGFESVNLIVEFGPLGVGFDLCESNLGHWDSMPKIDSLSPKINSQVPKFASRRV